MSFQPPPELRIGPDIPTTGSSDEPLGEVVASDTQSVDVECHRLYLAPPFGSFVRLQCVGSGFDHVAVVTRVSTGPFDGNRVVQAHRLAPGELEQRKPHLADLLRTTFQARLIGFSRRGAMGTGTGAGTPPLPPRLHCFAYVAAPAEIRAMTAAPAFLRPLTQLQDVPIEDLIVGAIQSARAAWGSDAPLPAWGKYLARLLAGDYFTLEGIFERLAEPLAAPPADAGPTSDRSDPTDLTDRPTGRVDPSRWEVPHVVAGSRPLGQRDPFEDG